jgi:glycosyltransferase involved in cell wall biosynthesis
VIDIALVVVTFNSAGHLDRLLDSLDAALGGLLAALVFVDNDSQDDTVARLRARREVEVLALPVNPRPARQPRLRGGDQRRTRPDPGGPGRARAEPRP